MIGFQNYHCHSEYTNVRISDSVTHRKAYAERVKGLGHQVLSCMEHGWQGNYYEAYKIAKEHGLKLVIGAEAYWVKDRHEQDKSNCHIYIGAKNENGRQAINDVLSEANITGFYFQPRVDIELLLQLPPDDVIVTTACVAYWKYDDVDEITEKLYNHFKNNFFLEVQYHNTDKQREINRHILELRKKLGCGLIMGCDSHYILEENKQDRVDFLASKNMNYPDEEGWFMDYPDGDTAYKRFAQQCVLSHEEILEAMNNTNIFLEVEDYNSPIFNDDIKMPTIYPNSSQDEKNETYKSLIYEAWNKYKTSIPTNGWERYEKEIAKEIQTVIDTNTADYFINNHYIIKQGKKNGGKLTKTGRGSAVSFITSRYGR